MLDPTGTKVAFNDATGRKVMTMLRRFVTEGSMPLIDFDASRQQFVAGQIGLFFDTPARLRQVIRPASAPVHARHGGVPDRRQGQGRDPDRRLRDHHHHQGRGEAEGRVGIREVHHRAGSAEDRGGDHRLLPTNKRASGPEFLGPFYDKNPNFRTVALKSDRAVPWKAIPGQSTVQIWRTQRDIINAMMRGEIAPDAALEKMAGETDGR